MKWKKTEARIKLEILGHSEEWERKRNWLKERGMGKQILFLFNP